MSDQDERKGGFEVKRLPPSLYICSSKGSKLDLPLSLVSHLSYDSKTCCSGELKGRVPPKLTLVKYRVNTNQILLVFLDEELQCLNTQD